LKSFCVRNVPDYNNFPAIRSNRRGAGKLESKIRRFEI